MSDARAGAGGSRVVLFAGAASRFEAPGIASRAVMVGGVRWALVEYGSGVLRDEWCEEGHSGFVLDGEVAYEFQDGARTLTARAGQGFVLTRGTGHRGRAGPDGVRLFLIDRAG